MSNVHSLKKVIRLLIVPLLFWGLYGCASGNQYNELTFSEVEVFPAAIKTEDAQGSKPKLAIAFGGGASRGMMHLGVIKALDEAGIKADIVTGTSVGSIAAALYSSNEYPDIERKMFEFSEHDIVDISLSRAGLIEGKALAKWVNQQTGYDDLRDLPITTGIVATNLTQKKAVMLTEGDIGEAVQTSSSVPGVFIPVHHNDDILVDGGILSLVPVYAARQLGADIVIGVDVFCSIPPPLKDTAIDTMASSFWLQSCIVTKDEINSADIVIVPSAPDPSLANFGGEPERMAAMQAGYKAMKKALVELESKLGQ
ncbi:patatin-like phospholipase family protein [Vibrio parahaemolyticus]|nr:patatin-like phospholipase family protein [Vibrio parahaemolyticus]ELB2167401.1 patatin-like phospholipase family protein [Vibrio parahaemolyticus]ELB2189197.1 patatin-like phospholipase family protein [Vibrio parahaemolyticus]ELB2194226.1 patatin-like phospholipase family protein [Vibrio parahaemolyticus]ELB2214341.1 patatin-like phospholipase family protein [Vibrio parahaemolyticus]